MTGSTGFGGNVYTEYLKATGGVTEAPARATVPRKIGHRLVGVGFSWGRHEQCRLVVPFLAVRGKDNRISGSRPLYGVSIVGPGAGANAYATYALRLNPFVIDHKGSIEPGSIEARPMVRLVCADACRPTQHGQISPWEQSRFECPDCGGKTRYAGSDNSEIGPDDVRRAALERAAAALPIDGAITPRAWAVYRRGKAPAEFVPEANDEKAMAIALDLDTRNLAMASVDTAIKSGVRPDSFVLEKVTGWRGAWMTGPVVGNSAYAGWGGIEIA